MSLSLGKSIKKIQDNQILDEVTAFNAKNEKEQKEILYKVSWIEKVLEMVKNNTKLIAEQKKEAHFYKDRLNIGNTKNIDASLQYTFLFNGNDINIVDFFRKKGEVFKLPVTQLLDDFEAWMKENDIKDIELSYAWSGGGEEAWNDIWLTPL